MQPLFNAFANQTHSNSSTFTPSQMQAFKPNMLQNSVPTQPQMGIMNPQVPFPLCNSNMPATAPLMNQNNFMNASNPLLVAQSNHLGLPQLSHMSPIHGNFGNMPLNVSQGQIFGPNLSNLAQQLNQNMGFSNGQMCLQHVNQLLSMQMSNPGLFGNPQFGLVNQNQQNFVQPIKDAAGNTLKSCSSEPRQGQNLQPSAFMRSQRNSVQNGQGSISNSNWRKVSGKNSTKNRTKELSQGFQKSHFHQTNIGKRKFGFHNDQKPKGHGNGKAIKFGQANHMNQPQEKKRKSLALTYTEQEIKQWCEERRKNYPTKANINKKLTENQSNSDVIYEEAKIRREQLKEILAKQAELGVEVAEVPSHYLLDSEKQVRGRMENRRPLNKRGRFQNNYDKRGRYNRKNQFSKEQKLADKDSSNNASSFNKKKPTLLQKLLSADVKRDKSRLLQSFRFVAINSFFKDWPEKPLNFPLVMVKEGGVAVEVVEERSLLVGEEDSEGKGRRIGEHFEHDKNKNDDENMERTNHNIRDFEDENDDEEEEDNDNEEQMKFYIAVKGNTDDEHVRPEEEEGEIID